MNASALLVFVCLAGSIQAQNALDQVTVLKCAQQIEVTAPQAKGLSKIAGLLQSFNAERDKEVEQYVLSETGLSKVVDKMLAGTALSNEDQRVMKRAEQGKLRIHEKFRARTDEQIRRAIAMLTDKQLFTIALRKNAYERAFMSAEKIRSASAEGWPKVRENLALGITDDEFFAVYSGAATEWEQATGKRSDVKGSEFNIKAAGIESQLEAIRQKGRDYLQQIRNTGAPESRINEVAGMLLKRAVQALRTWPSDERLLSIGPPDNVPGAQLMLDGGRSNPYHHARLMEDYFYRLMMTPGAPQTLENIAGKPASL